MTPAVIPDEAKLDRARSLCSHACWTIARQVRRLRSEEPEDKEFIFRFWADLQFLIVMLRRLRTAAVIASSVPEVAAAINEFDRSLPQLAKLRNVGEHIDDYATEHPKRRRHSDVPRGALEVGSWDGASFEWLVDRFT
jgi:hypothetical protein